MSENKRATIIRLLAVARRIAWNSFALFGIGTVIYFACFNVSRITSASMAPTLQGTSWENGDVVLTEKFTYKFRKPRRWEVMTFRKPDNTIIMKRVIGLPGEIVQIPKRGQIFIDGQEINKPQSLGFLDHLAYGNLAGGQHFPCGDGYYVLGDDSVDSDDSRFNGTVPTNEVIGRAWIIWHQPDVAASYIRQSEVRWTLTRALKPTKKRIISWFVELHDAQAAL